MKYQVTDKLDNNIVETIEANSLLEAYSLFTSSRGFFIDPIVEIDESAKEVKEIPLEYYHQRHERYKGLKLGFSNLSFQNNGCFTVCLAYLVKKDPLEVHELLKKEKCYNGAKIISHKAAKTLGLWLDKESKTKGIYGRNTNAYFKFKPQFETIKEVLLNSGQHFVVRLNKKEIFDSWEGRIFELNHYKFVSFRYFKVK